MVREQYHNFELLVYHYTPITLFASDLDHLFIVSQDYFNSGKENIYIQLKLKEPISGIYLYYDLARGMRTGYSDHLQV